MPFVHSKRCRYCRQETMPHKGKHETVDHVIPQWVMRAYPDWKELRLLDRRANAVTACAACNRAKGGMPVATFLANRHNGQFLKAERRRWDEICAKVSRHKRGYVPGILAANQPLRELILAEFSKPIPEHFSPLPVKIEPAAAEAVDWVTG